jgi:plastocyanin
VFIVLYFLNLQLTPGVVEVDVNSDLCGDTYLVISKGTTVRWINSGAFSADIDLTSMKEVNEAVRLPPGATYSLRFDYVGSHEYYCVGEQSQIVVE